MTVYDNIMENHYIFWKNKHFKLINLMHKILYAPPLELYVPYYFHIYCPLYVCIQLNRCFI